MRPFIERALGKVSKLNEDQLRELLKALIEESETWESAIDSMVDGIIICDERHFPIQFNKAALHYLGLTGDIKDKPVWTGIADEDLARFFRDTLQNKLNELNREFGLESGSALTILSISIGPLLTSKRINGSLINIKDLTDRRRKEAQLHRAESLASLTTLAAKVAHEIKNPLGSISIRLQLMKKSMAGRETISPAAIARHLEVVEEEVVRLNSIVVDFLFAVRPMGVQLIKSDITELIEEMVELVEPEAQKTNITIMVQVAKFIPRILLDARLLKQALLNLINNAIAAMPDGGTLEIKVVFADDEVSIIIKDTGIGISDSDLPKIFEPYFSTKASGTGLGLTIAYKIIKEHKGEITVKSKLGRGSQFKIILPAPQTDRRLIPDESSKVDFRTHVNEPLIQPEQPA